MVVAHVELPYTYPKLYANIPYDIGVNVTNLGSSPASTFTMSLELFWVKSCGILEYCEEKNVNGQDLGASTAVHFDAKITHASPGLDYVLDATADCNNDVAESNEQTIPW